MPSGVATQTLRPFSTEGVPGSFLLLLNLKKNVFNANTVDLDQTPRSAASDLGLYFF